MIRTIFFASLVAFGTVHPAAAQAEPRSHSVSLSDLDLASEAGRAKLDRNLKRAALTVCGAMIAGDQVGNALIDSCRTETLAQARRDVAVVIASRAQETKLAVRGR